MSCGNQKQLIGFIMIWISVGMVIMVFIKYKFLGIILAAVLMLVGYFLFCKNE